MIPMASYGCIGIIIIHILLLMITTLSEGSEPLITLTSKFVNLKIGAPLLIATKFCCQTCIWQIDTFSRFESNRIISSIVGCTSLHMRCKSNDFQLIGCIQTWAHCRNFCKDGAPGCRFFTYHRDWKMCLIFKGDYSCYSERGFISGPPSCSTTKPSGNYK